MKKTEFFKVEGDRITRVRKYCPKCGPAVFLADHKNRFSCGKCGYTEFKGGGKPFRPAPVEEKPVEASTEAPAQEPSKEQAPPIVEGESEEKESEATKEETISEEKPAEETPKEEESSEPEKKEDKPSDEDKKE